MKNPGVIQNISGPLALVLIVLLILAGSYARVLDNNELDTLDFRFRLRPPIPVSDKLVLIEIGNDTIKKLEQFPFDRSYHAVLAKALSEAGAEAVVFDIFFSEPHPHDEEFEEAIIQSGRVYLPYVLNIKSKKQHHMVHASGYTAQSLDFFTLHSKGTGHINIIPDPDGKFRRVPLLVKDKESYHPYLAFLGSSWQFAVHSP